MLGLRDNGQRQALDYGLYGPYVKHGDWWRLITSGFLHASVLHLGFNMFALYMIGGFLERIIGPVKFALIYAVSLIGGSLGVILLAGPRDLTVGASGAITPKASLSAKSEPKRRPTA